MIRLCFSGASGTGKTTLATAVAGRRGLPLCPVGARSVAADMGFASPYDVDRAGRRAEFQRRLLAEKVAWEAAHEAFVTDRSVIDNLTYAVLHGIAEIDESFLDAVSRGSRRYTHLVYCSPKAFQQVDGDPVRLSSSAYHEIYDTVLRCFLDRYVAFPLSYVDGCRVLSLWQQESAEARLKRVEMFLSEGGSR